MSDTYPPPWDAPCRDIEEAGHFDTSPGMEPGSFGYGVLFHNYALMCLINAERVKFGVPPIHDSNMALLTAASKHARAGRDLKWWGPGQDSHKNPVTSSTTESRIKEEHYCVDAGSSKIGEVTYTGWAGKGTPRAAVHWWVHVSTEGHKDIVLDPEFTEFGAASIGGNADPAGDKEPDSGTFVVTFGFCRR